jgi:hypothetical protein
MAKSDDTAKKKVDEAQSIIMEAVALNGIELQDAMAAVFTIGISLLKHMDAKEEKAKEFFNELYLAYKRLEKK